MEIQEVEIQGYFGGYNSVIAETLRTLPVKHLNVDAPCIHVEMSRPLTPSEAYRFAAGMGQDTPEQIEDTQVVFDLWWD